MAIVSLCKAAIDSSREAGSGQQQWADSAERGTVAATGLRARFSLIVLSDEVSTKLCPEIDPDRIPLFCSKAVQRSLREISRW